MSIAELPLQINRERFGEFCRARGIRKLSLFGSVLRKDFDPGRSDVDVLAEFEPNALRNIGFATSVTKKNCQKSSVVKSIFARV